MLAVVVLLAALAPSQRDLTAVGGVDKPSDPTADPSAVSRAMTRAEMERRIGEEAPRLLAETALQPVTEAGRVTGFAPTPGPAGSLLSDAGPAAGGGRVQGNEG